ncbi:esterase-like activity of phytase family protein [Agromyces mediolanus]|uniref:esterase-like activity of phytase family protein n=1 Tax=Agromyces mediolanus TaxID=41986 RepID=UPI00203BFFFA|nr:esterase-like activity of phytase family protein [Agromyces mediolanus]MCM3657229.1 esterase-like activity of phytase family protein [Agromyces mediolanus]
MPARRPLSAAALAVACLAAAGLVSSGAIAAAAAPAPSAFVRTATYPVFQNVPAGVDPAAATVAEISTITDDGTVVYTDALGKRIGFLDVSDPVNPVGTGTVELAELGHADDQPTSVAAYGDFVLVVVDETGGDFVNPKGRVDVLRASDRSVVRSIDLGGQPDSIAISKDGAYAAIAMENQRDEDFTPAGGKTGDLPQLPAGFVQVLGLVDPADPAAWTVDAVPFVDETGAPIPVMAAAGLDTPQDPEPEYVTINSRNELAVTLQENNGIAIIDLPTLEVTRAFSAGSVAVGGIDVTKDGRIDLSGSIPATPREPDAIAWIGDDRLATANEGDWKGGTRGWTVFDAADGAVVWDAGNTFANLAVQHGLHNEDRAAKKGAEPEGISVAEFDGVPYAFVASERSNFVAVYDVSDPASPAFRQLLFSTNGPEGILPVPERDLLVVSSETDDAAAGVRASVNVYAFGDAAAQAPAGAAAQPSLVSEVVGGAPIGWSALGALAGDPTDASRVYAASDAVLSPATVYTVDVSQTPARITGSLAISEGGAPAALDVEGLAVAEGGGFWLAVEGANGAGNMLKRTDATGAVVDRFPLPAEIAAHVGKWGFEGVTTTGTGADLRVWAVLQRPLWTDPANPAAGAVEGDDVARIGRLDPATGAWSWFGYRLEHTAVAGDWLGLSEITAIDDDTFAIIERDKLNGPAAQVKRVTRVDIPADAAGLAGLAGALPMLEKSTAVDVLPALRATGGWTQEKLEGFAKAADGALYAVTDNDGLKDATGETVFLRLGQADEVFPGDEEPQPGEASLALGVSTVAAGGTVSVTGAGFVPGDTVRFELRSTPLALGSAEADGAGALSFSAKIPATTAPGAHHLVAIASDGSEVEAELTVTAAPGGSGGGTGGGTGGTGAGAGADGSLADTGFDGGWLAGAALLVLLGGGAALLVARRRREV